MSPRIGLLTVMVGVAAGIGPPRSTAAQGRLVPSRQDTAAVVATLQTFLDAIAKQDSALARSVLMTGSVLAGARSDGSPPRLPRVRAGLDDAQRIGVASTETKLERIWSPKVMIDGPMAMVWAPYDFHVNGKFTHCGIDTATMFHDGTRWRMLSLTYTIQPAGCPPTPLPPP